ncbi:MAG: DUF3048 C-terminal domain-containing protein [Acidimicrobiia bacterium]|nr:DUF3048 C-terminal domain-containing protein [Acidimicrobiia bacterium]
MPEVDFVWDQEAGGWRRYQVDTGHDIVQSAHVDAGGRQVAPTNVVILSVDYTPSPADGESPQAITVDSGEAVVLSEGQMVTGRWHRPNNEVGYELTDADGAEIGLAPGTTWVLLPEAGATQPLTPAESRGLLAHRR